MAGKEPGQRGGNDRGDPASYRGSELITQRGAGVAKACTEQLGNQGRLHAVEQRMPDGQRDDNSDPDCGGVLARQQSKVGKSKANQKQATKHIDAPPHQMVGQNAEHRDCEELQCRG